jgi:flagellar hook protein FlgE
MMRGMNAAISGLEASQTMLDTTANNLANVNTIGYKSQSIQFVDELSQTLQGATGPNSYNGGSNAKQVGLGVQVGSIQNEMNAGSTQTTGNPLDIDISGNGFLQVDTGDPTKAPVQSSIQYTRAGNLTTNSAGYLTAQSGQYIVGESAVNNGNGTYSPSGTQSYIQIPTNATNVSIGTDGSVTYTDQTTTDATFGQTVTAGYLQLATFPNNAGLTRDGGSMWSASPASGLTPVTGTPGTNGLGATISGELEGSNVDMASEFSSMITAQNAYEANSKVISTGAQMLQSLVQMAQ